MKTTRKLQPDRPRVSSSGISKIFKRLWYGPPLVRSLDELRRGAAVVEGTVAKPDEMLVSPVTGSRCVAYRIKIFAPCGCSSKCGPERVYGDLQVFCPSFDLHLDGGTLKIIAPAGGAPGKGELDGMKLPAIRGIKTNESLILPGMRIRVRGKVAYEEGGEGGFIIRSKKIEVIDERPTAG